MSLADSRPGLHPTAKIVILVLAVGLVQVLLALLLRPVSLELHSQGKNLAITQAGEGRQMEGPFVSDGSDGPTYYRLEGGRRLVVVSAQFGQRMGQMVVRFAADGTPEALYGLDAPLVGALGQIFAGGRIPERFEPWMGTIARDIYIFVADLGQRVRSGEFE